MSNTNKVIQGLWIGGELSILEKLSIQSFLHHGHEYHLYIYNDVKNVPAGAIVKDGNEILPSSRMFTYRNGWGKGSYAGFADFFRYHLLNKEGGWWADTDIICLKPFDFQSEYVIASSYEAEWGDIANNCVLKLPPDSAITRRLVEVVDNLDVAQVSFGETGPLLVHKVVKELDYSKYIAPHQAFCPITWRAVEKIVYVPSSFTIHKIEKSVKDMIRSLIRPHARAGRITRKSYSVHLWNEVWRNNQLDKNGDYSKTCLFEQLKRKYL